MLRPGISFLLCFILSGCATFYNPATQQKEFVFIPTSYEVNLGRNIARRIESRFELYKDESSCRRLNNIGQRVSRVAERKDIEYRFFIIDEDEINAFAIPGGNVYVNKGLLEITDDDELACILGHEIGHIVLRHSIKRLQSDLGYRLFIQIVGRYISNLLIERIMGITYDIISLGYSRQDELLADRLGVKYAYISGYNCRGMIRFLQKLKGIKDTKQGRLPIFLSSHPELDMRIRKAEEYINVLVSESE